MGEGCYVQQYFETTSDTGQVISPTDEQSYQTLLFVLDGYFGHNNALQIVFYDSRFYGWTQTNSLWDNTD